MKNEKCRIAGALALMLVAYVAAAAQEPTPQIGGMDVVRLQRTATSRGKKPEFLSVTLFPGRSMNVFQITADIPGRGETQVMESPSIAEAAGQMTGTGKDEWGQVSYSFGGAFMLPYASRITGALSADKRFVRTEWNGKPLTLPANGGAFSMHGLMRLPKAEDLHTLKTADGETETAVLHGGDFGGHWLSSTDVHFTVALTGQAVEVTLTATNVGNEPEPMGIGWHPYFSYPSGDRSQVRVHIPADRRSVPNPADGTPIGQLQDVHGTAFDFAGPEGGPISDPFVAAFTHLNWKHGSADAWLSDPKANYGLRVRAMTPTIRTFQAYLAKDRSFIAIEPLFNLPDPLGSEWKDTDTGLVTLKPGESTTWRVRLELFTPGKAR